MTEKVYKDERFEFALLVNDNLVCKRNFKINNFIEHSMESMEFKYLVDEIVSTIDNDLKSKSRVYTWYYGDVSTTMQEPLPEFSDPLPEPWEYTFKFIVTDNKKPVIEKIWDGRYYPKAIRDKVDIANKNVKITTKDGKTYTYDKNQFFEEKGDRLNPELYCLKAMIMDKDDLLVWITKRICETCSPRDNGFSKLGDYSIINTYGNDDQTKSVSKNTKKMKYNFNVKSAAKRADYALGKKLEEKTKAYFKTLY